MRQRFVSTLVLGGLLACGLLAACTAEAANPPAATSVPSATTRPHRDQVVAILADYDARNIPAIKARGEAWKTADAGAILAMDGYNDAIHTAAVAKGLVPATPATPEPPPISTLLEYYGYGRIGTDEVIAVAQRFGTRGDADDPEYSVYLRPPGGVWLKVSGVFAQQGSAIQPIPDALVTDARDAFGPMLTFLMRGDVPPGVLFDLGRVPYPNSRYGSFAPADELHQTGYCKPFGEGASGAVRVPVQGGDLMIAAADCVLTGKVEPRIYLTTTNDRPGLALGYPTSYSGFTEHDAFTAAAYLPTAQVGAHELPVAQLWFLSRAVPIELVQFVAAGE